MSDFKAKMHEIPFCLELRPRPRWGAYSAPPDTLATFKGTTSKGRREGKGWERRGRGWEVPPALLIPPGCRGSRIVSEGRQF